MKKYFGIFVLGLSVALPGCKPKEEAPAAAPVHKVDITPNPAYTPTLHVALPDSCPVPDGMTVEESTGKIFLNVPNFAPSNPDGTRQHPALLCVFDKTGKFDVLMEYAPHPESGKMGPMGLDFGPDGNLYVADNQFFSTDPTGKFASRILRVEMKDGKPTGKVDTVVTGLRLANAILIRDGWVYVSDTNVDTKDSPGKFGLGIIWRFPLDLLVNAAAEPLTVDPTVKDGKAVDQYAWVVGETKQIGRGDNSSFDGLTWAWGALYSGNFGDGVMYRIETNEDGTANVATILNDDQLHCCDGIFYDDKTDKIYINDSQANAIRTLARSENGEHVSGWLWVNDDTNGENGLLDQPAECVVVDGVLYVVNFDWSFPGLKNTTSTDKPYSISAIQIGTKSDAELEAEGKAQAEAAAPAEEVKAEEAAAPAEEVKAEEAAAPAEEVKAEEAAAPAEEVKAEEAAAPAEEVKAEEAAAPAEEVKAEEAAAPAEEVKAEEAAAPAEEVKAEEAAASAE